jgi:hypothetical protein
MIILLIAVLAVLLGVAIAFWVDYEREMRRIDAAEKRLVERYESSRKD